jgi:hypothetical protein
MSGVRLIGNPNIPRGPRGLCVYHIYMVTKISLYPLSSRSVCVKRSVCVWCVVCARVGDVRAPAGGCGAYCTLAVATRNTLATTYNGTGHHRGEWCGDQAERAAEFSLSGTQSYTQTVPATVPGQATQL